jgi:hypothetical protein
MSNNRARNINATAWTWAIVGVAFIVIAGVTWWATSVKDNDVEKIGSSSRPSPLGGGPAYVPEHRRAVIPPLDVTPVLPDSPGSGAVVTVTPVNPDPLDGTPETKPEAGARKPQAQEKPGSRVPGLFPMGRVGQRPESTPRPDPKPVEMFPPITHAGRAWSFTGTFARSGQVDITPSGYDTEGRRIYALAKSHGASRVIFVESKQDPGKYAIYR